MISHPYRIMPGATVCLGDIDTRDDCLFEDSKKHGKKALKKLTGELGNLQEVLYAQGQRKVLVILQAMDTGGKDGTIKGVFCDMDAMGIRVAAFKAPTELELSRDYLWRVHAQVPRKGEVVVFNRSHYEDIIAVRVRKIAPEDVWAKRYEHIVAFEKMLADEGTLVVKFFLHISPAEQKERLQARLDNPDKNWKFNPNDLKDRALWPAFTKAYEDMLHRTSTDYAPWFVIPADRKWYRNLAVAQIMVDAMKSMNLKFPKVDFDPGKITIE